MGDQRDWWVQEQEDDARCSLADATMECAGAVERQQCSPCSEVMGVRSAHPTSAKARRGYAIDLTVVAVAAAVDNVYDGRRSEPGKCDLKERSKLR